jgi:hypothetical protein
MRTDLDVKISRIRLFGEQLRAVRVDDPRPRERKPFEKAVHVVHATPERRESHCRQIAFTSSNKQQSEREVKVTGHRPPRAPLLAHGPFRARSSRSSTQTA